MNENMVIAVARSIYDINKAARDRGLLSMWTIFDRPRDHPDGFIARCFETGGGNPEPVATGYTIMGRLDLIRQCMERCGLYCMTRSPGDHPNVVETWM